MMKIKIVLQISTISFLFAMNSVSNSYAQTQLSSSQTSEQDLFLVAQKAFDDGFYDVAMRYIDQLLQQYPESNKRVQAQLLLGQCYFFQNQYLKAYDIFQKLLPNSEFKDATLYWLGETYLKGSDFVQAEKNFMQLIQLYPKSEYTAQAYYSLGWIYFDQGNFDKAQSTFQKLIQNYPTHQLVEDATFKLAESLFSNKNYEQAINQFKNFQIEFPKSNKQPEVYFYIGESYYYQKDFLMAVTYYAKAAEIAYDSRLTFMSKVSMGWCYLKLGKLTLSQEQFDGAIAIAKDKNILTDDVYLGEANLFTEMKDYEKALKAYNNLIEQFPQSQRMGEALLGKANLLYILNQYSDAINVYQEIIAKYFKNNESDENIEKTYFGLAWSYLKAGQIDQSIATFQTIKNKTASQAVKISALTQIGDAYQDVNRYDKAIEIYDQILKDYPGNPYTDYVQYRQGIALLRLEKIDAATLSFQSLQSNFPASQYIKDATYYLALAYFKNAQWSTAKEQIQLFLKDLPSENEFKAEAMFILGLCSFNLNDFDDSIKTFQSIIKNFPNNSNMVKLAELNIAKSLYRLGQTQESLKNFKLLVNKYPQTEITQEALIWLGDHYFSIEEFENTVNYYQQFIKDYPSSEKINLVRIQLGTAYEALGKSDEAVKIYELINDPKDPILNAKAKLAIAEIFSKEVDSYSAIETYEKIVLSSPDFKRDAYLKIAEIYKNDKAFFKTIEYLQKAMNSPMGINQINNVEIQFNIADIYEGLNQTNDATNEYFKIPYLYPNETGWIVKSYLRVARIFENTEKWSDAKTTYQKIKDFNTAEQKFAQERIEWIEENIEKKDSTLK